MDYPGKVITKNQVTPTQISATGVWTLDDAAAATRNNNWPVAGVPNPISKSLRFNSADSAYLNRTPASASNRKTWTWSGWVKKTGTSISTFISADPNSGNRATSFYTRSITDGRLEFEYFDGTTTYNLTCAALLRDPSAYYHLILAVDTTQATNTNRTKIYVNGVQQTLSGTYVPQNTDMDINNTVRHNLGRFQNANAGAGSYLDGYLTEVNFIDGQALTPSSFGMTDPVTGVWEPLKYSGTYGTNGFYLNFKDATSTTTLGYDYSGNANNWTTNNFSVGAISSKVLEIVDATKSGSVTLSATVVGSGTVNLTAFGGCGNISGSVFTGLSSLNGLISDWQTHTVYKNGSSLFTVQGGAVNNNSSTQTATQSRTAQTVTQTGISVVSGDVISIAFGANNAVTAYYGYPNGAPSLTISASSGAFIADGSANDSLTDVPTPWIAFNTTGDVGGVVRGNYCTFNSIAPSTVVNGTVTRSDGNLVSTDGGTTYGLASIGTIAVSSGKWYWEVTLTTASDIYANIGVVNLNSPLGANLHTGICYRQSNGYKDSGSNVFNGGGAGTAYGATYAAGDVIGVALDLDGGTITFYKNGVSQGTAYSSISGNYTPGVGDGANGSSYTFTLNAGQRPFAYTPPSGFLSLCTTNLPASTILKGGDYFNTVLYTGTGSSLSVTGVGFQPDLVWGKSRSAATNNLVFDAIRGTTKFLITNSTDAEATASQTLTAFNSDGFSLGTTTTLNNSGATYVAWNWKANGAGSSNTAGSVTSTVSVNTTSGFSIATWTNPGSNQNITVGHGLGVAPSMIIVKQRNTATASWPVWHIGLTGGASNSTYRLYLDLTNAQATATNVWGSAAPTSSVFGIGVGVQCDAGSTMVAYSFAAISGYSAFGSYTGNGSTDGPFIYTGFRPEFVMIKASSSTGDWVMEDTARSPYNVSTNYLVANASTAEQTGQLVDFLSNGFKIRVAVSSAMNGSGTTYVYAAFAENPFKNALAR